MAPVPIADDLFTGSGEESRLIGGKCKECGTFVFPVRTGCARCGAAAVERAPLSRSGTLWTWTSQGFPPKAPFRGEFAGTDPFEPWLVGVIELPGQLRVESLIVGCAQEDLAFGMPMRLVTTPFRTDEDGREIITFAFSPAGADAPAGADDAGGADHA
ncbi:Zn-ribbon domain-containing OB-fold protein [Actinomadura sp. 9N407]|uniref:Zn-ribbon domain-containing OB-fold protein n=1 Tax=Actinomadura sp. 9N407 TaxID=3375154 RepID=UPI00378920BD